MKIYIFNIVLALIFISVAGFFAAKIDDNQLADVIMWLAMAAWSISLVIIMQIGEKNEKLDAIKKLLEDLKSDDVH